MLIAVVFVSHLVFCHVNFILSGFSNFAIAEAVLNDTKKVMCDGGAAQDGRLVIMTFPDRISPAGT